MIDVLTTVLQSSSSSLWLSTGCWNVSHCQQKFYSGLCSAGCAQPTYEMTPGFKPLTKWSSSRCELIIMKMMIVRTVPGADLGYILTDFPKWVLKAQTSSWVQGRAPSANFLDFYCLKSPFQGFQVIQTGFHLGKFFYYSKYIIIHYEKCDQFP